MIFRSGLWISGSITGQVTWLESLHKKKILQSEERLSVQDPADCKECHNQCKEGKSFAGPDEDRVIIDDFC